MNEEFRKLFGNFLLKETKEGPMVISRTATEMEFITAKAARCHIPLNIKRISPDVAYFSPKIQLDRPAPPIK